MGRNIIVALDGISIPKAVSLAKSLQGLVWGFKVNDLLFEDTRIIQKLKKYGKVFADAKLHDIPNTVANSVRRLSSAGADMITVHAGGGVEMMRAARSASGKGTQIIGVTVLTSRQGNREKEVLRLARDIMRANLDGIVCSAHELRRLSRSAGMKKLIKVVPGIRPAGYTHKDDQKRIATPQEALKSGADYLVIGRPITQAKDPVEVVRKL